MIRKFRRISLFIFALALIVRLIYALFFVGLENIPGGDRYEFYAMNLIRGEGYQDERWRSIRVPVYPIFLAGVFSIFGYSLSAVVIIQIVISTFTSILIFFIALKAGNSKVAFISGLISCFYFDLFKWQGYILTETLFTFLLTLSILLLLHQRNILGGVALGLATLTRPECVLLPVLICIWFFVKCHWKKAIKNSLLVIAIFVLTLSPWTVRNYFVHNAFVPLSTIGGNAFWRANNPLSGGRQNELVLQNISKYSHLSEVELDRQGYKEGIIWLRKQSFLTLVKLNLLKIASFLYPFNQGSNGYLSVYNLTYALVLPFCLYGIWSSLKITNKGPVLFLGVIISSFITTIIFYGEPRFRAPISPYIVIFASFGIVDLWNRFKKTPTGIAILSTWCLFNILIYFYSEPVSTTIRFIVNKIRGL